MARPNKEGLDYFPLDCKLDDKVYMVEVELGLEGFALFIKLLMKIYNENYYIEWTDRKAKIFAKQNNTNMDVINSLINICFSEDLLNKKLYKKYKILTSNGIQKRYFHSIRNRKDIYVIKEYLIDGISNYLDNLDNVNLNSINSVINPVNDEHNQHSIVKDSIVNNSKEKERYMEVVFLTQDEYKKLIEEIGEPSTKEYVKDLSLYIQSKGKKYKSHYATILAWYRKDEKQGKVRRPQDDESQPKYIPKELSKLTPEQIERNRQNITKSKKQFLDIMGKKGND